MSRPLPSSNIQLEDEDEGDPSLEPYVRKRASSEETSRSKNKKLLALSEEEANLLRTSINSRERRRMHDLNDAFDELREQLPHSDCSSRMSKINTLLLGVNWIRRLKRENAELRVENAELRAQLEALTGAPSNLPRMPPPAPSLPFPLSNLFLGQPRAFSMPKRSP